MSPSSVIDKNVSPSHGSAKETLGAKHNIQKLLFRFSGKVDSFHEMHTTVADRINTAEIRD